MSKGHCNKCSKEIETCTCLFAYQKQREIRYNQRKERQDIYSEVYHLLLELHNRVPSVMDVCLAISVITDKNPKEILELIKEIKKDQK